MEAKDANCRLRHRLNVDCLAEIFQYLDSADLYRVGEMNEFYKQIIDVLVIRKHGITVDNLHDRGTSIAEVFERYGTNIRKINFKHSPDDYAHTVEKFLQSIAKYCATDQLKSATIKFQFQDNIHMTLPIQFRNVKMLEIYGWGRKYLSAQMSECLQHLRLERVKLDPNFDWTQLKSLRKLYLKGVSQINAQNFIALLRYRPNLEVFHHDDLHTVDGSI